MGMKWFGSAALAMMIIVACGETLAPVRNDGDDGGGAADGGRPQVLEDGGPQTDAATGLVDAPYLDYCANVDASLCWSFDKPENTLYAEGKLRAFGPPALEGIDLGTGH